MIAETIPGIQNLDREEKLQLAVELVRDSAKDDRVPHLNEECVRLIEARFDDFLKGGETGKTWEEVKDLALKVG